jgi:hypothetical protein
MPTSNPIWRIVLPLAVMAVLAGVLTTAFPSMLAQLQPPHPFRDMNPESLEGQAALYLHERGIVSGFADGSFGPRLSINRAQAAKILLLAAEKPIFNMRNVGIFTDVPDGQWYTQYVLSAAMHQIINGYLDRSFRPGNTINTAEFLKMLALTFDLPAYMPHAYTDVFAVDWFNRYAGAAQSYRLFPLRPEGKLQPTQWITRQEAAIAVYQILKTEPKTLPPPAFSSTSNASVASSAPSSPSSGIAPAASYGSSSFASLHAGSSRSNSSKAQCYFPPTPPQGCLYTCKRNVTCLRHDQCQITCE